MGLENPLHLLFVGVVALVVLGPRRLPDLARALGQGVRQFREAMAEGEHAEQPPQGSAPATPDSVQRPDQGAAADEH